MKKTLTLMLAVLMSVLVLLPGNLALAEETQQNIQLRFHEDGSFKIMQMSDFQDFINDEKPEVNPRSIELMAKAIAQEQPDLVVMTGDQIGGNMNAEQLQDYITQMVAPLEEAEVPWLVTYGNHDEDATDALTEGWNKIRQLDFYMSFAHNINQHSMSGAESVDENGNTIAVGDMNVLVYDNSGVQPLYNIWAFDSNRYAEGGYDIIRRDQVNWYYETSKELEAQYGLLNSLMFFHIPLPEWSIMTSDALRYDVSGHKYENECPGVVNSGLFAAAEERGDVRGMFVGHDHVNDYVGTYKNIKLGYDANVGFQTYGLGGEEKHYMRGVRVFELNAEDLSTFETRMLYASDLGIDVSLDGPALAVAAADESADGETFELTILHQNDIHGHVDRLPYYKTLIDQVKAEKENVLVLQGGDIFLRGEFQDLQGEAEMDMMNAMGFDTWVLGNNDFRVPPQGGSIMDGNEQIQNLITQAEFPTLCANVTMKDTSEYIDNVEPYTIKDINGIKVAVIGVTSLKPQQREWEEVSDKVFESGEITVARLVPELQEQSDIIIVLSHCGIHVDALIDRIPGVSAVIGADDHFVIEKPMYIPDPVGFYAGPIAQAGGEGDHYLGRLDLKFKTNEGAWYLDSFDGYLYDLDGVEANQDILDLIESYRAIIEESQKQAA
ncbi:MAG: metallophosphoesterase [Eubacteriales bacterium]|nr:metallophosphoesterase [Eubacteriales bacterium]